MRKKKDGCFKKIGKRISNFPLVVKIKKTKENIKRKVTTSPIYVKLLQWRDKLANPILNALLAFFNCLSPCWTFLFVKRKEFVEENGARTEIQMLVQIKDTFIFQIFV